MTSQRIIITGASKGLGAALAKAYAAPGCVLGLCARHAGKLEETAKACRDTGTATHIQQLDITNMAAVEKWISEFDAKHPLDLVIANAGIFTGHGPGRTMETTQQAITQLRTNLEGVINTVNAIIPHMQRRQHGHIAIISSLAALQPLADAPGYSASKTGLMGYGLAMREFLKEDNITVSMIYPGHIKTAQTEHYHGWLPALMSAERAAGIIKRGLDRQRTFIAFPKRLLWGIRFNKLLPWRLNVLTNKPYRFEIDQ